MDSVLLVSDRLRYQPVDPADLDAFHRLVQDAHVRRYLMDGNVFPLEWSSQRIRESEALFERRGVGLWLVYAKATDELVGFCGFLEIPSHHPEPQLVYALFERCSGKGYATAMARTVIAHARSLPGFAEVLAEVDAVNVASLRILGKLGFEHVATHEGIFGPWYLLRQRVPTSPGR